MISMSSHTSKTIYSDVQNEDTIRVYQTMASIPHYDVTQLMSLSQLGYCPYCASVLHLGEDCTAPSPCKYCNMQSHTHSVCPNRSMSVDVSTRKY